VKKAKPEGVPLPGAIRQEKAEKSAEAPAPAAGDADAAGSAPAGENGE
jgi:hypothetical protein